MGDKLGRGELTAREFFGFAPHVNFFFNILT